MYLFGPYFHFDANSQEITMFFFSFRMRTSLEKHLKLWEIAGLFVSMMLHSITMLRDGKCATHQAYTLNAAIKNVCVRYFFFVIFIVN